MKLIVIIDIMCFLCIASVLSESNFYKAGVLNDMQLNELRKDSLKLDMDVLVLQPFEDLAEFDKTVKAISNVAREGNTYVVANLLERVKCQNGNGLVGNNFVFDRNGDVVTVSRKMKDTSLNCNVTISASSLFTTDFGVTFGLLTMDDMILQNKNYNNLKNFVMPEKITLDVPFFSDLQFLQSWAYVNNANLVTKAGIFAGKNGLKSKTSEAIETANLLKTYSSSELTLTSTLISRNPNDLSQYTTTLLTTEMASEGFKDKMCHDSFCCEFYVKSRSGPEAVEFNLAVFNGITAIGGQNIGVQNCALLTKAGTGVDLERLTITANFTNGNQQYPMISSSQEIESNSFRFNRKLDSDYQTATIEVFKTNNVLNIGILGRNFSKDNEDVCNMAIYDYIFNDDVIEFFDYIWIRLRILIFVVSIYVLEML